MQQAEKITDRGHTIPLFDLGDEIPSPHDLSRTFSKMHSIIRGEEGLQPDDALDEFVKILFVLMHHGADGSSFPKHNSGYAGDLEVAKNFRDFFAYALDERTSADPTLPGQSIQLSDRTILRVLGELNGTDFGSLDLDVKSAALRVFLSGSSRRGLGIFLTPDPVVEAIIDAVDLPIGAKLLDPCCGSGGFLLHALRKWSVANGEISDGAKLHEIWACERNERILRLAEANLAPGLGTKFHRLQVDSLRPFGQDDLPSWFSSDQFDAVFTNPPFGVYVDPQNLKGSDFSTPRAYSMSSSKLPSEILFIERCIQFLRPGGTLAIVVPNSVLTTQRLEEARSAIDGMARLVGAISLPPETFYTAGTQSTTSVLFFVKHGGRPLLDGKCGCVFHARVSNIGLDATGRPKHGNQLPDISNELNRLLNGSDVQAKHCREVSVRQRHEFRDFCEIFTRPTDIGSAVGLTKLANVASFATTGRTPPRNQYLDDKGHFIVKVGNLTGCGIDWFARDRNFVSDEYMRKLTQSKKADRLIIKKSDILLTSTAHSSKYIAKKVDIVDEIPDFVTQPCTFVGEIMLIRPDHSKIDPHYLLSFLRMPQAQQTMQNMVRGQTAHLYPDDALNLPIIDPELLDKARLSELIELVKAQLEASSEGTNRRIQIESASQALFMTP